MIPVQLTLAGFLSYREPVTLDFTPFQLACIAGSNGAGKSSLLDAITYALFGKARRADETLINLGSDAARVEFTFAYEGNLYRIQRENPRGKTTVLEFQITRITDGDVGSSLENALWKPLTERSNRETQRKIEDTLSMDYDTFVNAAFFLQGRADQFTQQGPADRKRILGNILGLEVWEEYRKQAASSRRSVERELLAVDGRLEEINAELAEEAERKSRLAELEAELERLSVSRKVQEENLEALRKVQQALQEQRKSVDTLARQVKDSRSSLDGRESRLSERTAEKTAFEQILAREVEIRTAYSDLVDRRNQLSKWDEIALRFHEHEKRRQQPQIEIESEKARLDGQRTHLKKTEARIQLNNERQKELEEEVAAVQEKREAAEKQLANRERMEKELQEANQRFASAEAENPRLRSEMHDLKERINQLREAEGAACPLCGQDLSPENREKLVEDLTAEGKLKGDQYRANLKLIEEFEAAVEDQKAALQELRAVQSAHQQHAEKLAGLATRLEAILKEKETWEQEGAPRLLEIEGQLASEDFAHEARKTLAEVDEELKAIGYDAATHDQVRAAVRAGEAVEEELRKLEKSQAALEPLNREIEDLQAEISAQTRALAVLQKDYEDAAAALAAAEAGAPEIYQAQRNLMDLQERENTLRGEVGAARQRVEILDSQRERRQLLEAEREKMAQKISRLEQLEKAFGKNGVPALLIEQALPQIEDKANELLDRLSAGSMHIRFQTQRELKTRADLKETLDIQISDSAGVRDYEMYSGGEAFRVNFAIRLALSEILSQRAGARLQTLVIDEGFGSQDAFGRQRLIEAINMVKEDFEKILVITHIDELKDAFPVRIEITKTETGSQLALVH
jgi:exonuclease SbcC